MSNIQHKGMSSVNPLNDSWGLRDISLIKQDLINHFHIRQGEKLNDPTFGTIIWDVLFDPLTDQLKQLILDDVTRIINHDPRVSANSIILDSYDHGISVSCELTYIPYNITEAVNFLFDQDQIP